MHKETERTSWSSSFVSIELSGIQHIDGKSIADVVVETYPLAAAQRAQFENLSRMRAVTDIFQEVIIS
jgi:hypothetical protein